MNIAKDFLKFLESKNFMPKETLLKYDTDNLTEFINEAYRSSLMTEKLIVESITQWGKFPVELTEWEGKSVLLTEDIIDNFEEFERSNITPVSMNTGMTIGGNNTSIDMSSGVINFVVPFKHFNTIEIENLRRFLKPKFMTSAWKFNIYYAIDDSAQLLNYKYKTLFKDNKAIFSDNLNLRQKLQRIYNDAISHRIMDIVFNLVDGELFIFRKFMSNFYPYDKVKFSAKDLEGFKTKLMDSGGVIPVLQDSEPSLDFTIKDISEDGKYEGRVNYEQTGRGWQFHIRLVNLEFNKMYYSNYRLTENVKSVMKNNLNQKEGIIIVTGSRGSGKQVFCYATINEFLEDRPNSFIETYENPIEARLEGPIAQVEVNPEKGYGFGYYLRAMKRHSSNLYFIGEIRDRDTAEGVLGEGVSSALILTTTHAPDCAGLLSKLSYEIGNDDNTLIKLLGSVRVVTNLTMMKETCPRCSQLTKYEDLSLREKDFLDSWGYRGKIYKRNSSGTGCDYCRSFNYSITSEDKSNGDLYKPLIVVEGLEFNNEVKDIVNMDLTMSQKETAIRRMMIQNGEYKTFVALRFLHEGTVSLEELMSHFSKNNFLKIKKPRRVAGKNGVA